MFRRFARIEIPSRVLVALLLLAIESGLLALSSLLGPYVGLLILHLLLIYGALRLTNRQVAYAVAILAAVGKTVVRSSLLPDTSFGLLFAWHLFNNATVLLLICYLLDHQAKRVDLKVEKEGALAHLSKVWARSSNEYGRKLKVGGYFVAIAFVISPYGRSISMAADGNGAPTVSQASLSTDGPNDGEEFGDEKIAMLTIDDAPGDPQADNRLLEVLQRHRAKTVWFVNCANFDQGREGWNERGQTLLHIRDQGHMVGNHSYDHLDLVALEQKDPEQMAWQISECSKAIRSMTGTQPRYFRAPFGSFDDAIVATSNRAGMVFMNWSFSFDQLFHFNHDADQMPTVAAIHQLADTVNNGNILLLHDDLRTARVLDEFLTALEQRGFRFVLPPSNPTRDWAVAHS